MALEAERRLKAVKASRLRALVATASLELGIDIGDVDLVCQLGSPRSISALLQRVGRSGHGIDRVPKGRLFPLTRDDLVECTALLEAVDRGELDRIRSPTRRWMCWRSRSSPKWRLQASARRRICTAP